MSLERAYDPEWFRAEGHRLVDLLADYLHEAQAGTSLPVLAWQDPERAWDRCRVSVARPDVQELWQETLEQAIHLHHPGYIGHQINPCVPVAALAGLVSDLLNNGMGVYEMGVPGTAMERLILRETCQRLGLPESADGFLTSGGTLANLTALVGMRQMAIERYPDSDPQQFTLLVSDQAHYCVERAARTMGWGPGGVVKIPTDARFCMRTPLLGPAADEAQAAGRQVVGVVGSACSTSTGSFDDLDAIAQFCRERNLWFHVDGAHGAGLAFSPQYRDRLKGVQHADSLILDFHKMLMMPAIISAVIFREGDHGYRTFFDDAHYLWSSPEEQQWYNLAQRTFECTKSMMALKVFSVLKVFGPELFAEHVDRLMEHAEEFARIVDAHPLFELATWPQANIVCFRFRPAGDTERPLDELQARIREKIVRGSKFYIVQTRLRDETWLRVTVGNAFTSRKDFQRLLVELVSQAERVGAES